MSLSQAVKDLILGLMGGEPSYQKEVVDGLEGGLNHITYIETTQLIKNNDVLANIPDLSAILVSGDTYLFNAILYATADDNGGVQYSIDGTVIPNYLIWETKIFSTDASGVGSFTLQTNLGDSAGAALPSDFCTEINGTIKVNVGGTLNIRFAQQNPSNTSTSLIGSSFTVTKVS